MISRSRSTSTAAAISIECTTSANSTVTCLYFGGVDRRQPGRRTRRQKLAFSRSSVPHDPHTTPAVITHHRRPSPWPSRYVLRSRAIPPSRGSESPSRCTRIVTAGAGQQRAQPQQPDVAHRRPSSWRVRQPVDRGLGFGHVTSAPRSSSVSTRTPVAAVPHDSNRPFAKQMIKGGAHQRYRLVEPSTTESARAPSTC